MSVGACEVNGFAHNHIHIGFVSRADTIWGPGAGQSLFLIGE